MKSGWNPKGIRLLFLFLVLFSGTIVSAQIDSVRVIPVAHAHNDYLQKRPLFDALDNGFASIEVDVFYRKGSFRVAHTRLGIRKKKTLQFLYLDPLRQRVKEHNGSVYSGWDGELVLMLDLKGDWDDQVFEQLEAHLQQYSELFTVYDGDRVIKNPVRVLLSGSYSLRWLAGDGRRIVSADGRLWNMDSPLDTLHMPRTSTSYRAHFKWRGKGPMPEVEKVLLTQMVDSAKAQNRKLRFWGTPDHTEVWSALLDSGVYWINVDNLKKFTSFYLEEYPDNLHSEGSVQED